MNILYISSLTGEMWAGPNYSVPKQIAAQSKIDNCFWYNVNSVKRDEWCKGELNCYNTDDYPSGKLADLPEPFNHPDLAVIEMVYYPAFLKIVKELRREGIPYIIVPRSNLTGQAQAHHALKKKIGNFLFFNKMIKNAAAIQYLTDAEQKDSEKWKVRSFVIPNGIDKKPETKEVFHTDRIAATYIGRIEIYQKGLDMLVSAIAEIQDALRTAHFQLQLYGPDRENAYETLSALIEKHGIRDLITILPSVFDEEKKEVLLQSDVFIMTSRFEGLPMGLIEALSYGIPVLVTEGTYMAKEVDQYEAGWTSGNDVEGIKKTLLRMIGEREHFGKIGRNAELLSQNYAWEHIAEQSHRVYSELIR